MLGRVNMYFIIFVVIWYIALWLGKSYKDLSRGMNAKGEYFTHGIWGILVHGIRGFTMGYSIWFIYYCISNYPYDLF